MALCHFREEEDPVPNLSEEQLDLFFGTNPKQRIQWRIPYSQLGSGFKWDWTIPHRQVPVLIDGIMGEEILIRLTDVGFEQSWGSKQEIVLNFEVVSQGPPVTVARLMQILGS